ncbi:Serine/threonine-protein phosphatase CPPED1 [Portunus trituberculatus]|uniref:Serine/threonine-protein phosphatase CPPED1 n=1 Tax=Portunus trituberculatus TaxID=210409 RepID=A0A5B7HU03_PORTR|nr:Serine/threonine-protein phosphatase CPPED1 [Portunus trituberculatus]
MEGVTQTFQIKTRDRKYIGFEDTEAETQWQGAFTFIQAADTQLGLQEKYIEKKTNPGWEKEVKWCTQMVTKVNKMNPAPKFLVICGDLIDAYPYERNGEEKETRQHQENDLKMVLSELQIPLVCVCGNHDVGDTPTAKTILKYQSSFGDDYFSFWCGGAYFLALNSQFWQDRREVETLARAQDEWLEAQLLYIEQHKPRHSIILQHIPPFIDTIDEPSQYFNLPSYIRQEMLDRFITAGVRYVFCGHYHRNAGGVYNGLEVIVTSAVGAQLGTDVNGYRVVNVMEDKVVHCYHGVE